MKLVIALVAGVLFTAPLAATENMNHRCPSVEIAHSGGTDKCGCHTKSSTGEYHCHTRKQRGGDCPT